MSGSPDGCAALSQIRQRNERWSRSWRVAWKSLLAILYRRDLFWAWISDGSIDNVTLAQEIVKKRSRADAGRKLKNRLAWRFYQENGTESGQCGQHGSGKSGALSDWRPALWPNAGTSGKISSQKWSWIAPDLRASRQKSIAQSERICESQSIQTGKKIDQTVENLSRSCCSGYWAKNHHSWHRIATSAWTWQATSDAETNR